MAKKQETKKSTKNVDTKKTNNKKVNPKKEETKKVIKEVKKEETKKVIKEVKKEETKVEKVEKKELTEKKNHGILFAIIGIIAVVALGIAVNLIKERENKSNLRSGPVYAILTIKDYGEVFLELDADTAPITVTNFIDLANRGFYDGLTFHRMIKGFMMQGGDPEGSGFGDTGAYITGEFEANGYTNKISHTKGTISMARGDDPNSASCQFFIVTDDSAAESLDGYYAAFGKVIDGMDVIDKVMQKYATKEDKVLDEGKRPIIESIREITLN